jgi:hypothetical protein
MNVATVVSDAHHVVGAVRDDREMRLEQRHREIAAQRVEHLGGAIEVVVDVTEHPCLIRCGTCGEVAAADPVHELALLPRLWRRVGDVALHREHVALEASRHAARRTRALERRAAPPEALDLVDVVVGLRGEDRVQHLHGPCARKPGRELARCQALGDAAHLLVAERSRARCSRSRRRARRSSSGRAPTPALTPCTDQVEVVLEVVDLRVVQIAHAVLDRERVEPERIREQRHLLGSGSVEIDPDARLLRPASAARSASAVSILVGIPCRAQPTRATCPPPPRVDPSAQYTGAPCFRIALRSIASRMRSRVRFRARARGARIVDLTESNTPPAAGFATSP